MHSDPTSTWFSRRQGDLTKKTKVSGRANPRNDRARKFARTASLIDPPAPSVRFVYACNLSLIVPLRCLKGWNVPEDECILEDMKVNTVWNKLRLRLWLPYRSVDDETIGCFFFKPFCVVGRRGVRVVRRVPMFQRNAPSHSCVT